MEKVRSVPALYEREEDCCGCSACSAVCPKQAITMKPDEKGFDYPTIDDKKCICCGLCMRVCPLKHKNKCFTEDVCQTALLVETPEGDL